MNQPLQESTSLDKQALLPARSCRNAAALFNVGNMVAVLFPPAGLLWLAASMVIYAMNRHHPEARVGHYTQIAAYRIYAVAGLLVAAALFVPKNGLNYYLAFWAISIAIIFPLSIRDLLRIRRDDWQDINIKDTQHD